MHGLFSPRMTPAAHLPLWCAFQAKSFMVTMQACMYIMLAAVATHLQQLFCPTRHTCYGSGSLWSLPEAGGRCEPAADT